MKSEIKIPAMGESISEATIGNILKPSGSAVRADDELLELETDKVNQVLYASQAGVVTINVKQGDTVKIGQVIGSIDTEAKAAEAAPKEAPKAPKAEPKAEAKVEQKPVAVSSSDVRKTKEAFVAEVKGQEPQLQAAEPSQPAPALIGERTETRRKMSKIRKVIAERLVNAQHTTAMLTTFNEIDMSHLISLREKYKEPFSKKYGTKLGFMSFFVKASVAALQALPDINSYIDGDEIVHREYYDIGIAVGTDRGVIVPVVRDCDRLTYAGIETAIDEFSRRAKKGTLSLEDLQGAGFTITNGGVYGSLLSTPILIPPQSGILGMHNIEKRAVVINDQVVIRPMMYVALSYDHRIVDGKEAVMFLVTLKQMLEDPSRLLIEI